MELPALNESDFRRQIFGALIKRANGALEAPAEGADPEFDRLLGDRKWAGDPLFLMMAGLAAAKAGVKGALSLSRADLALGMGRNELDRIGRIGATRGIDEKHPFPGAFVRHMAAIATLLQGRTVAEARELASREIAALKSSAGLDATVGALTDALPASDANGGVAPILPDIIGEAAILFWFGPNGGLATGGIDAAGRITAVARASVGKASSTLMRTAQDFAEAGYVEPINWLEALAGAPETDLDVLMEIANVLPTSTLALRETAAHRHRQIANLAKDAAEAELRSGASDQRQWLLATALNNLGPRLSDLGRSEEALAVAQEATDIYRRLAAVRPDAIWPELASSLNNLGGHFRKLGRREEALAVVQEATNIYRRLAAARPDAFLPNVASSLNNLACLRELGRREEALPVAQEATDIYRRLVAARPDAFLPDLALLLNNLGNHLSDLSRREEALAVAEEATDIYRRLVAARSDAFLPDLAMSLNNLGIRLGDLGRRDQALAAAQEAIPIYRRLSAARPKAFLPDLARSLHNLGNRLSDLGRGEEALAAAQEAVEIRRPLAAARPDAFLPDLALSLNNLGNRLSDLGRGEEALAAAQEAVEIRRHLAAALPDAFLSDLASSLNSLGNRLSDLGRREDALAAAQEATDTNRRLADARPDAFLPDLAMSLNNLGTRLSDLGRREDALAAAQEATDANRRLADARPDAFLPDLAVSLNNLGNCLSQLGRRKDALAPAREAVATLAPFFHRLPSAYGQWMAVMERRYLEACEGLDVEPDAALLTPIVEALEKLQDSKKDPNSSA